MPLNQPSNTNSTSFRKLTILTVTKPDISFTCYCFPLCDRLLAGFYQIVVLFSFSCSTWMIVSGDFDNSIGDCSCHMTVPYILSSFNPVIHILHFTFFSNVCICSNVHSKLVFSTVFLNVYYKIYFVSSILYYTMSQLQVCS